MPSHLYAQFVAETRKQHARSKTYSGKLARFHVPAVRALARRYGCKTLLDYGSGKGVQYAHKYDGLSFEEYTGLRVTRYDPGISGCDRLPIGKFDMVVCQHVLGCIPQVDLAWVIDRLFSLAGKVLYVANRVGGMAKKDIYRSPEHLPHDYGERDWLDLLARDIGLGVIVATRLADKRWSWQARTDGAWQPLTWPVEVTAFWTKPNGPTNEGN